MLKKDKPLKLSKPNSTMRLVYDSIKDGNHSMEKIRVDTKKFIGQVKSALHNLSYIGMVKPVEVNGRTHWYLPDQTPPRPIVSSEIFNKCPSIFMVSIHQ